MVPTFRPGLLRGPDGREGCTWAASCAPSGKPDPVRRRTWDVTMAGVQARLGRNPEDPRKYQVTVLVYSQFAPA